MSQTLPYVPRHLAIKVGDFIRFNPFSAEIDLRRQNLTSIDAIFCRLLSV